MNRMGIFFFLAVGLLVPCLHAGEEKEAESIKVISAGMGVDSDAALKNALKNAVSQAVGSIIDSETMVKNDEVIEDKILSHSGGFVEKYDVIGEPKAKDGLVTVRIEAEVKRMNLKREMEANNIIVVKKIDGQVFTKQIQLEESAAMFKSLLKDFPEAYIDVALNGEPYYDDKKDQFVVEVTTTLDTDKVNALTKDLIAFLDAALPEPASVIRNKPSYYETTGRIDFSLDPKGKRRFFLPVFINSKFTSATWKRYTMNDDLYAVCREVFHKRAYLDIDITIEGDVSIIKNSYVLPAPFSCVGETYSNAGGVAIAPYLNVDVGGSSLSSFQPGKGKTTRMYRFDLDSEEVKMIKDVKISVVR